jgi:hypothetical protein
MAFRHANGCVYCLHSGHSLPLFKNVARELLKHPVDID